jgi:hypothetical protein
MTGPIVHTCAAPGCSAWGLYGEGVRLRRGKLGTWWCPAHVPARLISSRRKNAAAAADGGESEVISSAPEGRLL